tara:strand:- start:12791 stop:13123 length:333 start_codon:yes stop_codon:yes gene_type:complete
MDLNIFNKIYASLLARNNNIKASLIKIQTLLSNETRESNEMLKTYQKYILNNEQISKEELDQANRQFSDLLKSLGIAGIFAMPGGLFAIAFIVKVGHKLGIDIIPEKYRK